MSTLRVTVWNEFIHEKKDADVAKIYPGGIHETIAAAIREKLGNAATVRTATQDQPEHGLSESVLAQTDVLTWWGHVGHADVADAVVERVHRRVLEGMGILFLHSAHYSKPFIKLMGTGCGLKWRDSGEREILHVVNPSHEIADGLPASFEIPREEMYGEFFDVPAPEEIVLISGLPAEIFFAPAAPGGGARGKSFISGPGTKCFLRITRRRCSA